MAVGISVKLPLRVTGEDGAYALHKYLIGVVKQNFKNLVLTSPGERFMDPNFGVGAFALLFENYNLHLVVNMYLLLQSNPEFFRMKHYH